MILFFISIVCTLLLINYACEINDNIYIYIYIYIYCVREKRDPFRFIYHYSTIVKEIY